MNERKADARKGKSCQSNYPLLLGKRSIAVLKAIEESPISITPKEISQKTGIKVNTVHKCVRRLERKGYIKREIYGHYVGLRNSVSLGSSIAERGGDFGAASALAVPRVHCLRFYVRDVVGKAGRWEWPSSALQVKFFRYKKGTAQVFCDCVGDYSLDYVAFRFLTESVLRELGCFDWGKVSLVSPEFNKDLIGWRLDGAKAVTLKAFDGSFRRIYQKRFGLRDEVKLVGSLPVEKALVLMEGGVSAYNLFQFLFLIVKQAQSQNEELKICSGLMLDAIGHMGRLVDACYKSKGSGKAPSKELDAHRFSGGPLEHG
jgi:ribosomal protein S25